MTVKNIRFEILSTDLFDSYKKEINNSLAERFEALTDSELSVDTFSFYTSVAAVFSSKIEGESIELDSYVKHKRFDIDFLPDYTRKIDDLYEAYQFAKLHACNQVNLEAAHTMLTKNILPAARQGKERSGNMYVTTSDGKIEYVAAAPQIFNQELQKLFGDLESLVKAELSLSEVFFFASQLHLVFVKIHPFDDGNGRAARLLEKWFLATKLGGKAWFIQSEKNYYAHHQTYYKNIRRLGLEYRDLDFREALPFMLMLPEAINIYSNE
jgi:Fic family protein